MTAERTAVLLLGDTLNLGGTEGQFVEVAAGLDRSRWDVHVSCVRAEGPLGPRLAAAGIRAWSCGRGAFRSPRFLTAVWGLVRYVHAHRIRLVHSFDFYSNVLGVPAARLAGVPAVIASQRDLGDLRPPFRQRVHRAVLGMADHVLVNSEAVATRLRVHRTLAPRIVVIPNGVDLSRFSPAPGQPRRRAEGVIVGTLANLRPEKGVERLIRAAALVRVTCPKARFAVWGEGPLRADLELLIRRLGLADVVELRGRTAEPEAALRALDIFVLPSLSEACSNVLLEAMATELPVVATRVGGNPALVVDEITGLLVPPGDPVALAQAILRLIEEPALAARLAARARDRVRAAFGIGPMLARTESLYDRALAADAVDGPPQPSDEAATTPSPRDTAVVKSAKVAASVATRRAVAPPSGTSPR